MTFTSVSYWNHPPSIPSIFLSTSSVFELDPFTVCEEILYEYECLFALVMPISMMRMNIKAN
jgi:hypothetical protein